MISIVFFYFTDVEAFVKAMQDKEKGEAEERREERRRRANGTLDLASQ